MKSILNNNPMTINHALKIGQQLLKQNGMLNNQAINEARNILAHVTHKDITALIAYSENILSPKQITQYNSEIIARSKQQPLAYIHREKEFYSLNFYCGSTNNGTLIPRPDSETIVECALHETKNHTISQVLDIGCGSGCLGIAYAVQKITVESLVLADIDECALQFAHLNAQRHLSSNINVDIVHSNWFASLKGQFDLIISNPPYICADDLVYLPQSVRYHEPIRALWGGDSGLQAYYIIAEQALNHINENGVCIVEIGMGQRGKVESIFSHYGWQFVSTMQDLSGIDRTLVFTPQKLRTST